MSEKTLKSDRAPSVARAKSLGKHVVIVEAAMLGVKDWFRRGSDRDGTCFLDERHTHKRGDLIWHSKSTKRSLCDECAEKACPYSPKPPEQWEPIRAVLLVQLREEPRIQVRLDDSFTAPCWRWRDLRRGAKWSSATYSFEEACAVALAHVNP